MTTNRVGEFDEAFKSRIHISLYYPKLDRKSTIKIWEMNLARIERSTLDIDVEEEGIKQFAIDHWVANKQKPSRRWNGRQIKNAFQTAIALATWDYNDEVDGRHLQRPRLTEKHFDIVSQTSAHFDDYLSKTHQIDEDETFGVLAQREGLRNDDVPTINWGRGIRGSSAANSRSRRHRSIRNGVAKDESYEDEEGKSERSDDDVDVEMRELERKLQQMRRRKSSTKDRRDDDYDDEEENDEPPRRKSKTKPSRETLERTKADRDTHQSRSRLAVEDSSDRSDED